MRDGLYETGNGRFFVCKDGVSTGQSRTKEGALDLKPDWPSCIQMGESKWIAPLYPANGIWKHTTKEQYFACKNERITDGGLSIDNITALVNQGKFVIEVSDTPDLPNLEYISRLPTSRIKFLSGEFIRTLDPPKVDFDVYVKNFGFFNEVSVESVVRFARENYPCWEAWLLENGIPFEEAEIQIGDIVKVTQEGKRYSTYRELADRLGAKRYICSDDAEEVQGKLGRVINIGEHPEFKDAKPVALVDIISEEILIGVDGLRKVS